MQTFTLNNGVQIPVLGFGVFQIPPAETAQAVAEAIKAGYRHIDTAQAYMNEAEVGQGVKQSGVPREEIFITSKVWVENYGYEAAKASLDRSLGRLNLDYIDMVLIHQPYGDSYGTWRALEEYQAAGKIRAIGVSNFSPVRAVDLGLFNKVMPQANQIEINPFQQKNAEIAALQAEGIAVEAWAPFAEGKNDIFHNPVLSKIGAKYGKSVAQVITRWLIERDIVVLAKSTKLERMAENLNVFDFALSDEDKAEIAKLDGTFAAIVNHDTVDNLKRIAAWKTGQ
ncbi:aldo/keto reductase [Cardiobacterium valvarum]|uniref:Organophosphate reductase n=1 Tax=Cardiobacterium valvarum F0432 TaxID=797473 RepID=G9ZC11_9GAMM|nr:aldo/keto reductase [Cardiobacterium valvarum]EHM55906.1 organophosphate reductase [Cardiobacterium valvarum F0432]